MATIEQRNKDFYTEKGLEAIINRMKNLVEIFNGNTSLSLPIQNFIMFGFGKLNIYSKEELKSRILELSDWTGMQVRFEKTIVALTDGSRQEVEVALI